jgi:hypothetical protein
MAVLGGQVDVVIQLVDEGADIMKLNQNNDFLR